MSRGSIFKRGTKERPNWNVIIEGTPDPVTGKRNQLWYSGFRTKKEAEQARTKLLHEQDTGQFVEPSRATLEEVINQWLAAIEGVKKPSTWQNYRGNMDLHVIPYIGKVRIQQLTASRLNSLYGQLAREGKKSQKKSEELQKGDKPSVLGSAPPEKRGLSAQTVRNIHTGISATLSYAVKNNIVARNVAASANPPTASRNKRGEMTTWTAEQVKVFLDGIQDNQYYAAYLMAATTGMRRGEVLGLRWCDLDLEARNASVCQTLVSVKYKVHTGRPKNDRSNRCIALDSRTVAALRTHKARQNEDRLARGSAWEETGFVFTAESGRFVHPDRFSKVFKALVKKSDLTSIRLHDLRHTWATIALSNGIPAKVVSEQLGHSSITVTMDTYSHVTPAFQKEVAEQFAALVFGA